MLSLIKCVIMASRTQGVYYAIVGAEHLGFVQEVCNLLILGVACDDVLTPDRLRAAAHMLLEDLTCPQLLVLDVLLGIICSNVGDTLSALADELF